MPTLQRATRVWLTSLAWSALAVVIGLVEVVLSRQPLSAGVLGSVLVGGAGWYFASIPLTRFGSAPVGAPARRAMQWVALLTLAIAISAGARVLSQLLFGGASQSMGMSLLLANVDRCLCFAVAIVLVQRARESRRLVWDRARVRAEAELEAVMTKLRVLEAQLHPHFLFNALHSVVALAADRSAEAVGMLQALRNLISRSFSPDSSPLVTVEDELALVRAYVQVQQTRFGDALRVSFACTPKAAHCLVPRLVLQPLVENAVYHGLSGSDQFGTIEVRADVEAGMLILSVRDSGRGSALQGAPAREGTGLTNTRRRLEHLFGSEYSLSLAFAREGGCNAVMRLPARVQTDTGPAPHERERGVSGPDVARGSSLAFVAASVFWLVLTIAYVRVDRLGISLVELGVMAVVQSAILAATLGAFALLALRFPIDRRGKFAPWNVAVLAALSAAVVVAHLELDGVARSLVTLPRLNVIPLALFDLLACLCVAAITHRKQWTKESDLMHESILRAQREAAEARLVLQRSRVQPARVDGWLAQAQRLLQARPDNAVTLLVAIADYLRSVLRAPGALSEADGQDSARRVESLLHGSAGPMVGVRA